MQATLADQLLLVVKPAMLCPECRSRLSAQFVDRPSERASRPVELQRPPANPPKQRLLTMRECAEMCSISTSQAYALAKRGELPAIHLGKSVRVPLLELREFTTRQVSHPS